MLRYPFDPLTLFKRPRGQDAYIEWLLGWVALKAWKTDAWLPTTVCDILLSRHHLQ